MIAGCLPMTPEQLRAEALAAEGLSRVAGLAPDRRLWLAAKAVELRHQASRLDHRAALPWRRDDPSATC